MVMWTERWRSGGVPLLLRVVDRAQAQRRHRWGGCSLSVTGSPLWRRGWLQMGSGRRGAVGTGGHSAAHGRQRSSGRRVLRSTLILSSMPRTRLNGGKVD